LIPTIYDAYKTKKVLNIVDGSHDFIHIDDVMDCMLNVDVKDGDVINVGTGISTSNIEVVNTFENIVQKELEYNQVQKLSDFYSERDNMEWSCDTDYAENEYQFVPKISFKKGLEKYINYREGINE
jgi:nucleoside-diphosphate-sugar epimerase